MKRRVAVRAIIVDQNGQLFAVRLKDYEGGTNSVNDFWCVPGGGVDAGEALLPALERELIEELGVKPVISDLLYIQQFQSGEQEHLEFFFHVTNADDFLELDLSKTTHGDTEIAEYGFIDTASETVLPKFLSQQDYKAIKPSGNTTQIFNYMN